MKVKVSFKYYLIILFGILSIILPHFLPHYLTHMIITFFIWSILSESVNLMASMGYVSLGHASLFGVSAYIASLLIIRPTISGYSYEFFADKLGIFPLEYFPITIVIGACCSMILSLLLSYPLFILRGPYFSLSMLALAELLRVIFLNEDKFTYGARGITLPLMQPYNIYYYYYVSLTLFVITVLSLHYFLNYSKLGVVLKAIKDDEITSEIVGINTLKYKTIAFTISAFFAGLAGGLFAHYVGYVHPESVFNVDISLTPLIMVLIGGVGTLEGGLIGSAVVLLLKELARSYFLYGHLLFSSFILIIICLIMPEGITGVLRKSYS